MFYAGCKGEFISWMSCRQSPQCWRNNPWDKALPAAFSNSNTIKILQFLKTSTEQHKSFLHRLTFSQCLLPFPRSGSTLPLGIQSSLSWSFSSCPWESSGCGAWNKRGGTHTASRRWWPPGTTGHSSASKERVTLEEKFVADSGGVGIKVLWDFQNQLSSSSRSIFVDKSGEQGSSKLSNLQVVGNCLGTARAAEVWEVYSGYPNPTAPIP